MKTLLAVLVSAPWLFQAAPAAEKPNVLWA